MPELVSDGCLKSLANVERVYGATPSALAGLEVRLGEPERYADYFFLVDTNEVPLVGLLWHEIDYEQFARGDSIVPCLFANTGLWQFPVDSYDELWDQILVPFLGPSRTRLLRPALDSVTASLPKHAFIKHLGTMTARGELDRVRLAIVFSQWDDMYEGLRSIGWPGDVEAFREAIEPWRELGSVAACVDVAQDGVQPKLGVELLFPRRHPVLADRFIARLEVAGLCLPSKAAALRRWARIRPDADLFILTEVTYYKLGYEDGRIRVREAIASTTGESRIARILEGVGAPLAML